MKLTLINTLILALTLGSWPLRAGNYDFLPVSITGPGAKFTSPNGNGFITVTNTGGPFLSANNTAYSSQFPNKFPASGTVPGWVAQADNNANYTNTFYLNNYSVSSATVFGIWNITEESNSYRVELFDVWGNSISPNLSFMGWDDDALAGNIGWYHMTLNTSSGYFATFQFKPGGIDCDAAFWNNLPPNTKKIVVTGKLSANNADGVAFYFAEPRTNVCAIQCPADMVVPTCGTNAIVNFATPILTGPCGSNSTIVCSPPSGSIFPLGTNTVTCSVVNGPVVIDSCTFTIVVQPSAYASGYDFLPVVITGPGAKFTSPNGNGTISVTNTGGPFLGLNNTAYSSKFPNLFPASVSAPGWLAQADNNARYTNTFYLNNYSLTPDTVFGIWNITEETNAYQIQLYDASNILISPPFNWHFIGYDDDSLSGNPSWYHMVLNTATGFLVPAKFNPSGTDCDAAFWDKIPANTKKIVVTGVLGAANADGVVFYFAERKPCACRVACGTNDVIVTTCGTNAVVTYPPPALSGPCASNITVLCSPASGSAFPVGTNLVTCSAVDGPVIVDSCTFTVTVVSNCPVVLVDCNCLAALPALQTNACQAVVPNLCQFSQCWLSPAPLQCSQWPPAGTVVGPGVYAIALTFTDPSTGKSQTCDVYFVVNAPAGGCLCVPPPNNMVMWLGFDESSGIAALNIAGGNNGVLVNGPTRNPSEYVQRSLCYDGIDDFVQVMPYPAIQFGTGDFSMDAWVKPDATGGGVQVIVDHREENGSVVRGYAVFLGANNLLGFQIADGSFTSYSSSLPVPADGQWHLVAVTVQRNNSQGIRFYVDGVQDANPRDPTGHPGSVTAGPCYPFRVASRSSSVSGLFKGCIDEVELFRRAVSASELQAIYDAHSKGKCRNSSALIDSVVVEGCNEPAEVVGIIKNPTPVAQIFNYTFQSLPPGAGCDNPGPISITPASGSISIPPYGAVEIPVTAMLPPAAITNPGCACIRMAVASADGTIQVTCDGRICTTAILRSFCVEASTPVLHLTNLMSSAVSFTLSGSTPSPIVVSNAVLFLMSPENQVISTTQIPLFTIPAAGGGNIQISQNIGMPEYDPGRFYRLVLEADTDGDGQYEVLRTVPVKNVQTSTDDLSIRKNADGTIVVTWPSPCAILEMNTNVANPSTWVTAPVQTSPWLISPLPGQIMLFRFRQ